PGAGKENPYQADGQFARSFVKAVSEQANEEWCRQDSNQHNQRSCERQQREHRVGHTRSFLLVAARQEIRVNGNERGGQSAFAKYVLKKIWDSKSRVKSSRSVRDAEVVSEYALSDDADDPADQDSRADH